MMVLTKEDGRFLLRLARKSIEHFMKTGKGLELKPSDVPAGNLGRDGACFVTLFKRKGRGLCGCIGSLEAHRPLAVDAAENAVAAAFGDPRFSQLRPEELKDITIEISVLTPEKKLDAGSPEELLSRLVPRKHGLTIVKGWARATFLPSVWETLPDKEEFLCHLCVKAGLGPFEWKDAGSMEFYTYEAQEFEE